MRLCRWAVCAAVAPGALTGGEAVGSIPEWRTLERAHYVIMVLYVNPHAPLCARGAEKRAPLPGAQFLHTLPYHLGPGGTLVGENPEKALSSGSDPPFPPRSQRPDGRIRYGELVGPCANGTQSHQTGAQQASPMPFPWRFCTTLLSGCEGVGVIRACPADYRALRVPAPSRRWHPKPML